MSKGSKPRPIYISQEEFSSNWDKIFKNKGQKKVVRGKRTKDLT
jgi:hypothetical protein